jgi:hypothetical protein
MELNVGTEDNPGHIDYVRLAKEFIDGKRSYSNDLYEYDFGGDVVYRIIDQIIREAEKSSLSKYEFESLLEDFDTIISEILLARMPLFKPRMQHDIDERPPDDKYVKLWESNRRYIWVRHDPRLSLCDGYNQYNYNRIDEDEVSGFIETYLETPYLRNNYLEWVLLDMSITCSILELSNERRTRKEIKKGREVSKRESIVGDLVALLVVFLIGLVVNTRYPEDWSIFVVLSVALIVWMVLFRVVLRVFEIKDSKSEMEENKLWEKMYDVWKLLQGPIVYPKMISDTMIEAKNLGARFDHVAFVLIAKILKRETTMLIVDL